MDLKVTIIQTELHWESVAENLSMFSEKIGAKILGKVETSRNRVPNPPQRHTREGFILIDSMPLNISIQYPLEILI